MGQNNKKKINNNKPWLWWRVSLLAWQATPRFLDQPPEPMQLVNFGER